MSKLKAPLPVGVDQEYFTILNIAMTKAWNFGMEYDPYSGREVERTGFPYLKEGYIEGFLAGFAHKFGGSDE
ncbi:MAG: hypothetical protein WCK82_05260 [Bacteroidota bacterium]